MEHAASGILGETVVRGSDKTVTVRHLFLHHAAHAAPDVARHRVNHQNLLRGAHDRAAVRDVEQLIFDRRKQLPLADELSAGADGKNDTLLDKLFYDRHIFGIDLHRPVFYQCPVDIGGNQFYHGILRFMASVAPSVIIHKCIAVL